MNTALAIKTLDALVNGTDPVTGKAIPEASPYNQPVVLRSLFVALKVLQQAPLEAASETPLPAQPPQTDAAASAEAGPATGKKEKTLQKAHRMPPANAGKAWTEEEEQQLCREYDSGIAIKELAVKHSRSAAALNARLFKLGKIADPGFPLRGRPAA